MPNAIWNDEQDQPLQHLRIVDMTVMLPGPYLTRILAQSGAEVVKVENYPNGDPIRQVPRTALIDWLNQGKRSVAVNLKKPQGIELVRQLASEADVFVENFREGVMDGMGLGYGDLSKDNPDLLYVSLRGFSGKNAGRGGHDTNFVATSGCGEWFLENGPNYSTHWGDLIGGVFVPAIRLCTHLANPDRRGMHLVMHMDEGFRAAFVHRAVDAVKAETLPEGDRAKFGLHQSFNGSFPHSRYYQSKDGQWISINAAQFKHWEKLCETLSQPAWRRRSEDPTLIPEMEELFAQQPGSYWGSLLAAEDTCAFRVVPWSEHFDPKVRATISSDPLSWAGFAANPDLGPPPELGRDTYGVLHAMGLSNKEFSDYMRDGVLFQPNAEKLTQQ